MKVIGSKSRSLQQKVQTSVTKHPRSRVVCLRLKGNLVANCNGACLFLNRLVCEICNGASSWHLVPKDVIEFSLWLGDFLQARHVLFWRWCKIWFGCPGSRPSVSCTQILWCHPGPEV